MAVPTGLRAGAQLEVCKEQVEWARAEKRTFLRQRIEARLAMLHLGAKDYPAALALISRLLTEARRRTAPARSPAGPTCAWLQKALRALRRWAGRRGVLCDQRRRVLCMGGAVLGNAGHCVGRDCNGLDQLCIVHGDAPALVDIGTVQQACWRSDRRPEEQRSVGGHAAQNMHTLQRIFIRAHEGARRWACHRRQQS